MEVISRETVILPWNYSRLFFTESMSVSRSRRSCVHGLQKRALSFPVFVFLLVYPIPPKRKLLVLSAVPSWQVTRIIVSVSCAVCACLVLRVFGWVCLGALERLTVLNRENSSCQIVSWHLHSCRRRVLPGCASGRVWWGVSHVYCAKGGSLLHTEKWL